MPALIEKIRPHLWLIVPLLLVASMTGSLIQNTGSKNLYAYQAQAFLSGRLDLQGSLKTLPGEVFEKDGRFYSPFPPFPALLLTPFVAVFGVDDLKVTWVTALLACLACYLLFRILQRLEFDSDMIFWVVAAFGLGTAFWPVLRASQWVWMFAQIVCVVFILLALHETLGKGRGLLAGLFLGCAFLSRQLAVYTVIFLIAWLWEKQSGRRRLMNLLGLLIGLGVCVLVYAGFNYLRLGSLGTGYGGMILDGFGKERVDRLGLFNFAYLFFNSIYMFVQGFHLEFGGAEGLQLTGIDPFGTSLLAASPFVIAALRAKWEGKLLPGAWLAIILSLVHMLLYFNNGFRQFNSQRFSLDFLPILILLVALGFKKSSPDLTAVLKILIIYSILLNTLTFLLIG